MRWMGRLVVASLLLAMVTIPTSSAQTPAFTVDRDKLRAATQCDASLRTGEARRAVLLVHGTGATPAEAWGWNYAIALRRLGYGVCTVRLPNRALADLGLSAQYVAFAGLRAARFSEHKITILGHSQGGLLSVWAATFWPDLARQTSDVISLGGPVRGSQLGNTLCSLGSCAKVAWQMRRGSAFVRALNEAPSPRGPSFTSIGTRQDEVVFPQPSAITVQRGATILLQDVCRGRIVDHGFLLADAVGWALVLDALRHHGPARNDRIDRRACNRLVLPGVDPMGARGFVNTAISLTLGLLNAAVWVDAEPAVPLYAR
jgi:triacylglycerol lipase